MDLGKAKHFIEEISEIHESDVLSVKTRAFLASLGFQHFACVSHVDREHMPADAVNLHNYPKAWADHFARNHLEKVDPVQRFARFTLLPFSWEDPLFLATLSEDQMTILEDARAFGLGHGYTVPIHAPAQVSASFSVCPGGLKVKPDSHWLVQLISPFVFERAVRIIRTRPRDMKDRTRLTARQRQCLELAALGKSDWVIGEILGISERTVHHHLESAKKRLGVATRAQGIVEALRDAQISMADIQRNRASG